MFLGLVLAPHLCPHTQNTMAFFGSNATREKAGKEEKKNQSTRETHVLSRDLIHFCLI